MMYIIETPEFKIKVEPECPLGHGLWGCKVCKVYRSTLPEAYLHKDGRYEFNVKFFKLIARKKK